MTEITRGLTPAEDLLVLAVKTGRTSDENARIVALHGRAGDAAVWQCAEQNRVLPLVGHALRELLPAPLAARWDGVHAAAAAKTQAFVGELDEVAEAFDAAGLRFAAIEGGGIAAAGMCCPGCFASSDIDVLVALRDMPEADKIVRQFGFVRDLRENRFSDDPTQPDFADRGLWVYRKDLAGGLRFWLNLLWSPVVRRWCPPPGEMVAGDLLARSVRVTARNTRLRVPSTEDFLISCCVHTASHSYVRDIGLRLQLDVARVLWHGKPDWATVVRRARERGLGGTVFPALAIPRDLWGVDVPPGVLDELVPSADRRRAMLRPLVRAGLFQNGRSKFGRVSYVWFESTLFDGGRIAALWRVLFPPREWMRSGYKIRGGVRLAYCYVRRLVGLTLRRAA